MIITYFDIKKTKHLVEEFYHVCYLKEIVPFSMFIIPLGFTGITSIFGKGQTITYNKKATNLKGLILSGLFFKPYKLSVEHAGFASGINFKPTALHKLTKLNIAKITNSNISLREMDEALSLKFEEVFLNHNQDFKNMFLRVEELLLRLPLAVSKKITAIDNVIDVIHEKEGMLNVNDLLKTIPFSHKTLQTQFKKMVGITPSKYIRLHRFIRLMKKYQNKKIALKDLIFMYDYYDESHFYKDFKSFTAQSPKQYFKKEFIEPKQDLK